MLICYSCKIKLGFLQMHNYNSAVVVREDSKCKNVKRQDQDDEKGEKQ